MFEANKAMFIYCTTPMHAGAGQAFGVIDNPIQREKHTEHPNMAGSGVKGALRHHLWRDWNRGDATQTRELLNRIFGPEAGKSSDFAGAMSFSDAQLLLFPIRSVKHGYVYATSPLCLARAMRLLGMCGKMPDWNIPDVQKGDALLINPELLSGENLFLLLEAQQFAAKLDGNEKGVNRIAKDISAWSVPDSAAYTFFRNKIASDLVILSDTDFTWFVKQSTVVEAHVAIKSDTGTAKDGSLHYTENLPPESVLISAAMATPERKENGEEAAVLLHHVVSSLDGKLVQLGGDATTGRGQVVLSFTGGSHEL